MDRRTVLFAFTAGAVAGLPLTVRGSALPATRSDAEGPFYPVEPIPLEANLLLGDGFLGDRLQFAGRVLGTDGRPVSNALVEIWQCDANSRYRHPRAGGSAEPDRQFRGFGAMRTGADGAFDFTTIVPVPYPGRPPHIHAKVKAAGRRALTTQVYLQGHRGPDSRKMALSASDAGYTTRFDFVLA